jgi:hypothetical protein
MTKRLFAALVAVFLLLPGHALAQEKSATKPGFVLAPGTTRIVLFRPSITAGAQSTGGMFEPNADWTAQARENVGAALAAAQKKLGNDVIEAPELYGDDAAKLAEYQALFSVVANSVITYKFFPGNRLPIKKRKDVFDWTLGPGVADVAKSCSCDYALFIFTEDQYGSTGRKLFQVFMAVASYGAVSVKSGKHQGFAGLVDLHTGDLVWLNADLQMGGDVRTPDGAQKRVAQLLEDFPGAPVAATK